MGQSLSEVCTRPDLMLFQGLNSYIKVIDYLKIYIDLCSYFKCKNIVFGSPKTRLIPKDVEKIDDIFIKTKKIVIF